MEGEEIPRRSPHLKFAQILTNGVWLMFLGALDTFPGAFLLYEKYIFADGINGESRASEIGNQMDRKRRANACFV